MVSRMVIGIADQHIEDGSTNAHLNTTIRPLCWLNNFLHKPFLSAVLLKPRCSVNNPDCHAHFEI